MSKHVTIGSRVRSFDFYYMRNLDGEHSSYIEGEVTAIKHIRGCDRYIIAVDRCVSAGDDVPTHLSPTEVCPPVNGTRTTMGRITDGVEVITCS